jgi:hypothetical protein
MRLDRHFAAFGAVVSLLLITVVAVAHPGHSTSDLTAVTGADRHADAIAYADQLLGHSPTTRSELLVTAAPDERLLKTPLSISGSQVERRQFWTSSESVNATFAALKTQLSDREVSIAGPPRRSREVDIEQHNLPATIADADLIIRVVDTGNGDSAVAAYAIVVAQPKRPATEHVPLSVRTVQLVDVTEAPRGGSATRRFRTVRGPEAQLLTNEFDALRAEPPGLAHAAVGSREGIAATFRAGGHRWQASDSDPVSVTRDGHPLPDLTYDKAFADALLAGFHPSSARTRHAEAVAEAERLLRRTPTTSSETHVGAPPRTSLRLAPAMSGALTVVSRRRFWMSSQPLAATLRALRRQARHGMLTFGGTTTDHGRVVERDAEMFLPHLPATLASADLQIEVVPDGRDRSAVGAYAEVVPQPIRHGREFVPLAVMTVRLATINLSPHSVTTQRTVHGSAALRLIRDFNRLRVQPPFGARSCPVQLLANSATFRIDGHTWRVEDSICGSDVVTRDGHRLPGLVPSKEFSKELSADGNRASTSHGAWSGRLAGCSLSPLTMSGSSCTCLPRRCGSAGRSRLRVWCRCSAGQALTSPRPSPRSSPGSRGRRSRS